ncbi:endonuclease/exonuclease/phosphatase family protein [Gimesia algae]|uniref:Endonuclease/Exonuclease/phosphatase family protein n=1 Tax=Gimesia algae TaxID=2527971 RepID=A0A517V618_9PLAN|nr:endonuclease/exonuclease/phosphatase family protein [Gimesia algae]QDT88452.1 Endonuclease/Exonuclease/phosphatase family protein [Gimesia algae]
MNSSINTPEKTESVSNEPGWQRWMWYGLLLACVILSITAFLPLLLVDWWWVRIGDFPRLQLLVAYIVVLLAIIPFRKRLTAKFAAVALCAGIGIQLFWIFPYLTIASNEVETAQSQDSEKRLRILTANVLQKNTNAAAVLELIDREQPDIVVLCEVNQRWISDLSPLERTYSYHLTHPLDNTYGIAFYSNLRVKTAEVRGLVKEEIPSIDATILLRSGKEVRLFAVHPNPPRPGEDTTKRDAELVLVGREVSKNRSAIVLGDLNDVGWSRTTNLFQEVSGLLDPRKGRGLFATYDATSWIWRYPLDYLFVSDDFRLTEIRTLPYIGSDHFPLLVELSYEPEAEVTQEGPSLDAGDQQDAAEAVQSAREKHPSPEK